MAIESLAGKRVMILAPSSPSVEVLRVQGITNADTLQQFLLNHTAARFRWAVAATKVPEDRYDHFSGQCFRFGCTLFSSA